MAKQKGIFKVQGSIGGVNFYQSQDGFRLRELTSLDGNRIKTDAAFQRTRENGQEFAAAANAGKLFRKTFATALASGSDNRVISRLLKAMIGVQQADTTSVRGQRTVTHGNLALLEGFECNIMAPFSANMKADDVPAIDRVGGKATVVINPFVPKTLITAPTGTTHFKIVAAAAAIDFVGGTKTVDNQTTAELPWDNNTTAAINLQCALPAASTNPLFLLVGIQFVQNLNGVYYALNSGNSNALKVAMVSVS
jgi:hypothetical protein